MVYLNKHLVFATLAGALLTLASTPSAFAAGDTIAVGTGTTAEKEGEAARLADRFGEVAGSRVNALAVVEGLRSGKGVTREGVTVSGTGNTMGYGNINIAMSLARSQLSAGASSKDFLSALDSIMDMRAEGKGWGQIAHSLGVNLGQVMGASKAGQSAGAHGAAASRASGAAKVADVGKIGGPATGVLGHGAPAMSGEGQGVGNGGAKGDGNGNGGGGGGGGGKK